MEPQVVHRELLLPTPTKEAPEIPPLVWTSGNPFWVEIHRSPEGRVRFVLGSSSPTELDSMVALIENSQPRVAAGTVVQCPMADRTERGLFARGMPRLRHHHLPLVIRHEADTSGLLVRTFGSPAMAGHDVVVQLLFRNPGFWESGFLTKPYTSFAEYQGRELRARMDRRRAEPAYHVEVRAHLHGPQPDHALTALSAWLEQWTTFGGVPWRSWRIVPRKKEQPFHAAFATHDFRAFSSRKGRRDVSASELSNLLGLPWSAHHPECSYAGPPSGQPRSDLVIQPVATPVLGGHHAWDRDLGPVVETGPDARLVVGTSERRAVTLPREWNHLAILGRTQSGKSTLALNLVLQILVKDPRATVVVIEPTGTLVEGIVSRLSEEVAGETVEIDPANATFEQEGTKMVSVPLSVLKAPPGAVGETARDRWAEAVAGDLLAAVRNAWGEESIGGRAELVLRALVQGLSLTPGSNLVDAYHILSSKPALQRFVRSAPPGPLRNFLEHHLPRLDYAFTMSSLDKVGKIATNPLLRVALCQRSHSTSFDELLARRLLLLNLSKAAVGADGANFLGAVYLTQLWAALQRSGRPDQPVYLVLDEVHNYAIPTLADMLAEGAKFGLHAVAATQYLHRVPPRIRAALIGNVDAWLLFSLGVEDMDDAFKIVNGETHGWLPQDLVDGLRPHEVAMAVRGDLLKLSTLPSPPPFADTAALQRAVTESSRRYAQPEDSEASPWLVGQEEVEGSLRRLSAGPKTREELAEETMLPAAQLDGALSRADSAGDIERDEGGGTIRLTDRGKHHLRVLRARTNEGEDHVETLTELAVFLEARGIALSIPQQVGGLLLPDGQFQWGDATYNVEVECSTVAKAAGQVVRNVKKARAAGHRVLIALPDQAAVPRTLAILDSAFPGMRLWPDGVGVVWKEGRASFRPIRVPGTRVWPFLDSAPLEEDEEFEEVEEEEREEATHGERAATDPLPDLLRAAIPKLVSAGTSEATPRDLLAALPEAERNRRTDEQVGVALNRLGIPHRRVRFGSERLRVYDLTALDGPSEGLGRPDTGPSHGPAPETHSGPPDGDPDAGPSVPR